MRLLLFYFLCFCEIIVRSQPGTLVYPQNDSYFEESPDILNWNVYNLNSNYEIILTQDSSFFILDTIITTNNNSFNFNHNLSEGKWFWSSFN